MLRKLFKTTNGVEAKNLKGLNVRICPARDIEGKSLVALVREDRVRGRKEKKKMPKCPQLFITPCDFLITFKPKLTKFLV